MIDIDNMSTRDVVRAVEGLGRRRDEEDTRAREAIAARDEARKEWDALNRQCAHRERAIVAQAKALEACLKYIPASEVHNWPPGFRLKDAALKLSRAALADPLVVECVAQAEAEADDAEARRDGKMVMP